MAAHRYWRVRFWESTGANDIWLAEVEFVAVGSAAVVVPVAALSSGDWSTDYAARQAFDGQKTSGNGWSSNSVPCWIGGDFGAPVDIDAARIFNGWQASAYDELPVLGAVALEYSDDGVVWTEFSRSSSGASQVGGVITVQRVQLGATVSIRLKVAAAAPLHRYSTAALPLKVARDTEFGGRGRLWGTTKTEISPGVFVPTKARVSVLRQRDMLLAREVWSDPATGAWEVRGLDTSQTFLEVAQHVTGEKQAVAADQTVPAEVTP